MAEKQWVTLTDAALQLGIHPTTLRRWADNGSIPVYITPGGHRRFLQSDLDSFVNHLEQVAPDQLRRDMEKYALIETRQRLAKGIRPQTLDLFSETQRQTQRELGQRLLALIVQHIVQDNRDEELLKQADNIAELYARSCYELHLSVADALEIILFFRDNLSEMALQMPQMTQLEEDAHIRLLRKINQVFNRVQLSLVAAFQNVE